MLGDSVQCLRAAMGAGKEGCRQGGVQAGVRSGCPGSSPPQQQHSPAAGSDVPGLAGRLQGRSGAE